MSDDWRTKPMNSTDEERAWAKREAEKITACGAEEVATFLLVTRWTATQAERARIQQRERELVEALTSGIDLVSRLVGNTAKMRSARQEWLSTARAALARARGDVIAKATKA